MAVKVTITLFFIFLLLSPLSAAGRAQGRILDIFNPPFEPTLLYPIGEEVNLCGKDFLEFKWDARDFVRTRYYDFRLYKGYLAIAQNLIAKEHLLSFASSFKIKSDLFKDNQVYTWVLRRVSLEGEKSEASFNSFKVIKR